MPGKLYVVATPIGNSADITQRAKNVLAEVDIVAAEDTRTTQKLLHMLGIQNKTVSNHKFNEKKQSAYLISELLQNKDIAIVSDAGTPCISDPGNVIVKSAVENGIDVIGVCGASSVITALSISGFSFVAFSFHGFFPRENKEIRETFQTIKNSGTAVSVFFESPKRIKKTMNRIAEELPDSEICLCNDLTKFYEKTYRGTPQNVFDALTDNPSAEKGEYTLVIYTQKPMTQKLNEQEQSQDTAISCEALLVDYNVKHGGSMKDAIQAMQEAHKGQISKKEFYAAALNVKKLLANHA